MSIRDKRDEKPATDTKEHGSGAVIPVNSTIRPTGNLNRAVAGAIARPTGRGLAAVQKAVEQAGMTMRGNGSIAWSVDATGSRALGWAEAQATMDKMFKILAGVGKVRMRLGHFGGGTPTVNEWSEDAEHVAKTMRGVQPRSGSTMHLPVLESYLKDDPSSRASSVIMVGDAFEEDHEQACLLAAKLKESGIKVFTYLDGQDMSAEQTFKMFADVTGGVFAKFGSDINLEDFALAVGLVTVGGRSALERLGQGKAKQLLLGGPSSDRS